MHCSTFSPSSLITALTKRTAWSERRKCVWQRERKLWIKEERSCHQFCNPCKVVVPTKSANTTQLFQHLRHLPVQVERHTSGSRPSWRGPRPYDKTSKCYKEITDAVTYRLVKDLLQLRTAEKSGYKNLIHMLDPPCILISNRLKKINNYRVRG